MVPGANILDQLLGGFEVKPTGQIGATGGSGASAEGMESGLLFGDLLLQSMTEGASGKEVISNLLFPSNDQPAAQDEALAGPTVERYLLSGLGLPTDTLPVSVANLIQVRPDLLTGQPLESEKSLDLPITNLTNLEAMQHLETELKSGAYRILDSKLVDGRLDLIAVAEGSSDAPVKISIPESVLKESALRLVKADPSAISGRTIMTPIDGLPTTTAVLDELMSQLKMKVLEIKIEPEVAASKQSMQPVEVSIVAEQSGAEIVLKGKITRQAMQVRGEQQDSRKATKADILNGGQDTETKKSVAAKSAMLDVGADGMRRDANLSQFTLADRFSGNRVAMTNDNVQLPTSFDNTLGTSVSSVEHKTTSVVKMTLPEMIQKPFSAGGQSLMIKIEPEHLGPARLNLTLHNHVLTARLVVDTPLARMAVLSSLDQLTDQLSRAGIDVERIDVTLSGDSSRQQFLDQRPAWDYARKTNHFEEDFENGAELPASAPTVTALPNEYIDADRVNLLA